MPRPYLQEFLDFVFKNFNVSIWTAATESYAIWVIDTFITNSERKLNYLLHDTHCKTSMKQYGTLKDLRLLTQVLKIPNISIANTILIDDLEEVCLNQKNQCINIFPFTGNSGDKELLKMIEILKYILAN
jgi:TFIIF-interacting CTD phosphatase-like protein